MPRLGTLHELKQGAILADEHHAQGRGGLERSQHDFLSGHRLFEVVHAKRHVRQLSNRSRDRTVGFVAQVLDAVRVRGRVGDPHFGLLDVHLVGLSVAGGKTDVVELSHR
jgi:hypothetical protein